MENFLKRYFKGDYVIWVIYVLLIMVSIVAIYSAASPLIVNTPKGFIVHIGFLFTGFIVLMIVYSLPRQYIKILAWAMLAFAFVMQIAAYTPLGSADHRRIVFFHNIEFQPSEFIKFAIIVITAYFIDKFQNPDFLQKNFKLFFAVIWLPLLLIIPSNGSMGVIILVPIVLMMMIGSVPRKKIMQFVGIPLVFFGVFCFIAYNIPPETYKKYAKSDTEMSVAKVAVNVMAVPRVHTWVNRINTHKDKDSDIELTQADIKRDEQAERSQCAIYDGKTPVGPGNSFWRNYIPQGWSDYIFSIIVEEYGIIGALLVILLFIWLLWRAGVLVKKCETVYSAIVIVGVATVIVFQALVHIGVCTRLFPSTGQPLPLISKGGTSILIISAFFGLLLRMSCEVEEVDKKKVEKENADKKSADTDIVKDEISEEKPEEILILDNKNEIIEENTDEIIEISENDEEAKTTEISF